MRKGEEGMEERWNGREEIELEIFHAPLGSFGTGEFLCFLRPTLRLFGTTVALFFLGRTYKKESFAEVSLSLDPPL